MRTAGTPRALAAATTHFVTRPRVHHADPSGAPLSPAPLRAAAGFGRGVWERLRDKWRATLAALRAQGLRQFSRLPTAQFAPQSAADFELPASDGSRVRLSTELARGPVLLVFFRGVW